MTIYMLIVHIAGPSGSGKTHIGNIIQGKYKCVVKDLDNLWHEYKSSNSNISYQEYINQFIETHNNDSIVFVGIDANKCLPNPEGKIESVEKYDFNTKHLLYLRPNIQHLISQRFKREIDKLFEQADTLIKKYFDGEKDKIIKKINRKVDIDFMIKNIEYCDEIYRMHNYSFVTYDECLEQIDKILNK